MKRDEHTGVYSPSPTAKYLLISMHIYNLCLTSVPQCDFEVMGVVES